jgi:hypothetical protein
VRYLGEETSIDLEEIDFLLKRLNISMISLRTYKGVIILMTFSSG